MEHTMTTTAAPGEAGLAALQADGLRLMHTGPQIFFEALAWHPVRVDNMPDKGERVLVAIEADGMWDWGEATWAEDPEIPQWLLCWCAMPPAGVVSYWARPLMPGHVGSGPEAGKRGPVGVVAA